MKQKFGLYGNTQGDISEFSKEKISELLGSESNNYSIRYYACSANHKEIKLVVEDLLSADAPNRCGVDLAQGITSFSYQLTGTSKDIVQVMGKVLSLEGNVESLD